MKWHQPSGGKAMPSSQSTSPKAASQPSTSDTTIKDYIKKRYGSSADSFSEEARRAMARREAIGQTHKSTLDSRH
jgi:hypothetical protein